MGAAAPVARARSAYCAPEKNASFMDLVLSGVVGLVPSANGTLIVNPLVLADVSAGDFSTDRRRQQARASCCLLACCACCAPPRALATSSNRQMYCLFYFVVFIWVIPIPPPIHVKGVHDMRVLTPVLTGLTRVSPVSSASLECKAVFHPYLAYALRRRRGLGIVG